MHLCTLMELQVLHVQVLYVLMLDNGGSYILPFIQPQNNLFHSFALLAQCVCAQSIYINSDGLSAFVTCHLIALDKNPGVHPLEVGSKL